MVTSERNPVQTPPPFLTEDEWRLVIRSLELSPQQARIINLILQGKQDKEISAELRLNRYTIRTYLRRVFDRSGFEDRMALVLHIFAICLTTARAVPSPIRVTPEEAACERRAAPSNVESEW